MSTKDHSRITLRRLEQEAERRRREEERERRRVESVNAYKTEMISDIRAKVSELEDEIIRVKLIKALDNLDISLKNDITASRWRSIGDVREASAQIRLDLHQAQTDMNRERNIKLKIADKLENIQGGNRIQELQGLKKLYDSLYGEISKTQTGGMAQTDRIIALTGLSKDLDAVTERLKFADTIDFESFTEKQADLEELIITLEKKRAGERSRLRSEIEVYYDYLLGFDKNQAAYVHEKYENAMACDNVDILKNLNTTIYNVYTGVRGSVSRTIHFRKELKEKLPVLRGIASAAKLVSEVEEAVDAGKRHYVSREEYLYLNKKIIDFFAEQEEIGLFAKIAAVTKETLEALGYEMVGESENKIYRPGETRSFDSSEDDYRVELTITEDGEMKSNVLRLKEEEAPSSESDASVAKKWCNHLSILQGTFEAVGFDLENVERKEPDETTSLSAEVDSRKNAIKKSQRKKRAADQQKLMRNRMI